MKKSLDDVKHELSRKYLGRAGIHGVGIDRSQGVIRVYHKGEPHPDQEEVFKKIEEEAQPYRVVRIKDEPAQAT